MSDRSASCGGVLVLATSACIALSACGGGAGPPAASSAGPAAAPTTVPSAGPAGFATVSFSISLPKVASAANRKLLFVSPSTASISVAINGTTPQVFPCTPPVCSGSFLAPAGGQDTFVFSALDAQRNVLAMAPVTQAIAANGTNTIAVTLNGVVASATLSATPAGLSSAVSGQATLSATAYDFDGNVITGTYSTPILLTINGLVATVDGTGTLSVTSGSLASASSSGTVSYAYNPATAYSENHDILIASSSTMSVPAQLPFEVGRTFYTFTANSIVGFAPGSTSPTRTINVAPNFTAVTSLGCDGTNLYISDGGSGTVYGIAPGATTPTVSYTSNLHSPVWVAGDGFAPGTRAQFYVANDNGAVTGAAGFQGPVSTPFTIPPNSAVQTAPAGSLDSLQVDGSGNVYAAVGGVGISEGGYDILNPSLVVVASGLNANTSTGSNQIAVDTSHAPAIRVYTQDTSTASLPEISEYDSDAATPTFVSTDNDGAGLFVDNLGRIYTSSSPGMFHVYNTGGLSGAVQYSLSGQSLAFDSATYVYAVNGGKVTVYNPGTTTVYATLTGGYGTPAAAPAEFGTFCL